MIDLSPEHVRRCPLSKLAEKIRRATRLQSAALGFGAAKAAQEPTMVLVGRTADAGAAAELARRGADVVIVDLTRVSGPPPKAAAASAVAGAQIAAKSEGQSTACRQAGYDFVVFDPDTAAATALLDEDIGYVVALPEGLGDPELRTFEGLQLDAIDVGSIEGALTVRRQLDLRRIFGMTRKPLMATINAGVSVAELQAIRDTNVVAVVAQTPEGVERLRKTIDALPERRRRKDGEERPTPLVPRTTAAEGDEDDDE
jgi:hypothetical protein